MRRADKEIRDPEMISKIIDSCAMAGRFCMNVTVKLFAPRGYHL